MELTRGTSMSLKSRALRAGGWMSAAQVLAYSLRLLSSLILTRLLAPELFGLVSIVWTVTTIVAVLSDVGLVPVVVQNERGGDKTFLDTVWIIQIARGFVIWVIVLFVALALFGIQQFGWLASTSGFAAPELPALLAVAGMGAAISGFGSTKVCLAYRELRVASVLMIETAGQVVSLVVAVALASLWHSVWALVLASLVSSVVQALASHRFLPGPANSLRWNSEYGRTVFNFGKSVMASSAIAVVASNADRLVLGAVAAPAEVGWYVVAFTISSVGASFITRIVSAVALAALSETRRRSEREFIAAYEKLRLYSDTAMLAVGGLLAGLGGQVIHLLYDQRYAAAGHVLQVLGFSMLITRYAIFQQVYMSLGRPAYLVWINLTALLTLLIAVPLAYRWYGFEGAVIAIALRDLASLPIILWLNHRHGLNRWGLEIKLLVVFPLAMGFAMAVAHLLGMLGR